jgi:hypothetical protein
MTQRRATALQSCPALPLHAYCPPALHPSLPVNVAVVPLCCSSMLGYKLLGCVENRYLTLRAFTWTLFKDERIEYITDEH